MNIQTALTFGTTELADSWTPQVDARLLLSFVLQKPHTYLIAYTDCPLTPAQEAQYRVLVARAKVHEPIPYLMGTAPFAGNNFFVTPAVLIPRPETEELVEMVKKWCVVQNAKHIIDVGTGSGCIAITLAQQLPTSSITAVDISEEALAVAKTNAGNFGVLEHIHFIQGNLLQSIVEPVDVIVANLPYIRTDEWEALPASVRKYEPRLALYGGVAGTDLIKPLLAQAQSKLREGGAVFLEIGWQQGEAVRQLAHQFFPTAHIRVQSDLAGHQRFVTIQR